MTEGMRCGKSGKGKRVRTFEGGETYVGEKGRTGRKDRELHKYKGLQCVSTALPPADPTTKVAHGLDIPMWKVHLPYMII